MEENGTIPMRTRPKSRAIYKTELSNPATNAMTSIRVVEMVPRMLPAADLPAAVVIAGFVPVDVVAPDEVADAGRYVLLTV